MQKSERIVRYTANEIDQKVNQGEDLTDWERIDALTEEELEASIDKEVEGHFDLSTAYPGLPPGIGQPKKQLTVRLDTDVIDFFKSRGKGYQTRMNAVLRQFMEHEKGRTG
jgi:uncharacterized protein (DUF4415 family)